MAKEEEKPKNKKSESGSSSGDGGGITSPEGVLMLCVAAILDGIGLFLLLFGLDDVVILDIIGLLTISMWLWFRTGHFSATASAKKTAKKILGRLGLSFLIEAIPWAGGLCPMWTVLVFREMNGQNKLDAEETEENESDEKSTPASIGEGAGAENGQPTKQENQATAA